MLLITNLVIKMLTEHGREPGLDPHPQVMRYEHASLTGVVQERLDAVFSIGLPHPLLFYSFVKQSKILGAPWHENLLPRLQVKAIASRHLSHPLPSAQSLGRSLVQNEILSTEEEPPWHAIRAHACNIEQACARVWFQ